MAGNDQTSLYAVLAEEAPDGAEPGETLTTKRRETLDNDVEAFVAGESRFYGA
jgi:hypothetical protein